MTNQLGTILGITELRAKEGGLRKTYLVSCSFPAYTGASDTAQVSGVGAAILAHTRNGKTVTLRGAVPASQGYDTAAQAVYFTGTAVNALTVSTDALTGQLSDNTGTELTTTTGVSSGVEIAVIVDET